MIPRKSFNKRVQLMGFKPPVFPAFEPGSMALFGSCAVDPGSMPGKTDKDN